MSCPPVPAKGKLISRSAGLRRSKLSVRKARGPDFDPIEMAWSKIREKKAKAGTEAAGFGRSNGSMA
jgi:hypothetical protein